MGAQPMHISRHTTCGNIVASSRIMFYTPFAIALFTTAAAVQDAAVRSRVARKEQPGFKNIGSRLVSIEVAAKGAYRQDSVTRKEISHESERALVPKRSVRSEVRSEDDTK